MSPCHTSIFKHYFANTDNIWNYCKICKYLYINVLQNVKRIFILFFNWSHGTAFALIWVQGRGGALHTYGTARALPFFVQFKAGAPALVWEVQNNMTNNKSNVSAYVAECKENATIVASLEVLNDYRKSLLSECTNKEVVAARKALEEARSKYNKLATAYVLGEESYCNLQTECVRAAVSEFSHTHNVPRFFQWFNDNGKDEQTTIIDSVQRLGSKLASLHTSFASGSKVARKQKANEEDLTERIAQLQAELAALRGEK